MIPVELQDILVVELKSLFSGLKLKNANDEYVPLNIYPQSLPAKKHEDDEEHFPYIIARLQDGEDPGETDPHTCRLLLITGVYDDSDNYQGYRDTLDLLNKVYQHLFTKRTIGEKFRIEYPVHWSLPEDDVYPFYFGGLETNWIIGKVTQTEDDLY